MSCREDGYAALLVGLRSQRSETINPDGSLFVSACREFVASVPPVLVRLKQHIGKGVLPFCQLELRVLKPKGLRYPVEMKALGDHLRRRRIDLNLLQREVGQRLRVHCLSIVNWELNRNTPEFRHLPAIIGFLGYDPRPIPTSLPKRLTWFREGKGWNQQRFARELGVDPTTLARWERGERAPQASHRAIVDRALVELRDKGAGSTCGNGE